MRRLSIILYSIFFISFNSVAQELNCNVTINTDQIRSSETQLFAQMKQDVTDFMNNQRWTSDVYSLEERIKADIIITLTNMSGQTSFSSTVTIQSSRPVYGTDYESAVFNYVEEKVVFEYQQGQPLFFTQNSYTSNFPAILAFYAYLILGYDYDTFSKLGGTPHFQKALDIVNMAQISGDNGWKAEGEKRNRYFLIQNITNPQYLIMREGYYTYHRIALDNFETSPEEARKNIKKVIDDIRKVYSINPNAPMLRTFFEAKALEITNVFTPASTTEKQQVLKTLKEMDPTNSKFYDKMMQGGR